MKAIINPLSVRTDNPTDPGWDKRIGEDLMQEAEFPQIVFDSTRIETTGAFTGKVTGASPSWAPPTPSPSTSPTTAQWTQPPSTPAAPP